MEEPVETIRPRGKRSKKRRKEKINLVFDESKRKDFLTGFRKRNLEKKQKALEAFQQKLKEEKRRIKQESKESYKKLVVSHRPIPELEELLEKEYENEDVTVKILELSTSDIAQRQNWIGQNKPKSESEDEAETSSLKEDESEAEDELPGMALKEKLIKPSKKSDEAKTDKTFKSQKEIKKIIKKKATKIIQKSKTFKKKFKMEQNKNKKTSSQMKHSKDKFANKQGKMRHRLKWQKNKE